MRWIRTTCGLAALGALVAVSTAPAGPGRNSPERASVSSVTAPELAALSGARVVDVRRAAEHRILRLPRAEPIPFRDLRPAALEALRAEDGEGTPLVLYDDGPADDRAERAVQRAERAGLDNLWALEGGVLAWARHAPERTLLFGRRLDEAPPDGGLIPDDELRAHCLGPEAFLERVRRGGYRIFDLRTSEERHRAPVRLPGRILLDLDELEGHLERRDIVPAEGLLFLDAHGRRVRWVQYLLERHDRSDYWFLAGGVDGASDAPPAEVRSDRDAGTSARRPPRASYSPPPPGG